MFRALFICFTICLFKVGLAQQADSAAADSSKKYIEIIFAQKAKYGKGKDSSAQKLIGQVQLRHNDVYMYCDSAYFYQDRNSIKAFSRVKLVQGDTLFLTGNRLNYSGETRVAEVIGNVLLQDPTTYLECNHLFYYRDDDLGSYYTGGRLYSKGSPDTLTSTRATYFSREQLAIFKDSVVLTNPEYVMRTDTMHYRTDIKQSYFFGPTTITSDSNRIDCNAGWYNTEKNTSSFYNRAVITGTEQSLEGDSLYYDRNQGLGKAFGNVVLNDTVNDFSVTGNYAYSYNEGDSAIIPSQPLLYYFVGTDTLLLSADTVYALKDTDTSKTIYAFHNVLFHKSDIQGKCDSIIFSEGLNRLDMLHEPILWSNDNQITGNKISIFMVDEKVDHLFIPKNAFVGEQVDAEVYNQIKGKNLTARFKDEELYLVEVRGNGESVYNALENGVDSLGRPVEYLVGVNKAICSDMDVRIKDNKIDEFIFITQPKSTLHPPYRALNPEFTLKGFKWQEEERPVNKKMVRVRGTKIIKFDDSGVEPD